MGIYITLNSGDFTIPELGGRTLISPLVDYDLSQEFDEDEIRRSNTIQTAIDEGTITLKDSDFNIITNLNELQATSKSINNKGQVGIGIGNGIIPITTGVKSYVTVPYSGVITGWELLSTVAGSIVIDVWKDTYANYPPTLSDSICGIDKPTLSSQMKNNNNTLTTWSTAITEGDIIAFNVESSSIVTQVTLTLKINKT